MSAPAARWRSPLLSGALPPAKRHGYETGYHSCVAYKRARHHRARVPSPATLVQRQCLRWPVRTMTLPLLCNCSVIALCATPRHQTHAGGTQGIPLSATSVWEPLCGRVREHGRVMLKHTFVTLVVKQTSRDLMVSSRAGRARGYHHYGSSGGSLWSAECRPVLQAAARARPDPPTVIQRS